MNRAAWLAMETALLRIAAYPRTRSDEMTIEQARELARAALAYQNGTGIQPCAEIRRYANDGAACLMMLVPPETLAHGTKLYTITEDK